VHPVQKEKLGVRLLLIGELWFLLSLTWWPPLFWLIAVINFRWAKSVWLYFLDFLLASSLIIAGLILLKPSCRS